MTRWDRRGDMAAAVAAALDDLTGVATGTDGYVGDPGAARDLIEHPNGGGGEVTVQFKGATLWDLSPDEEYYVGERNGEEHLVWPVSVNGKPYCLAGKRDHSDPFHLLSSSQVKQFLLRAAKVVQETPADGEDWW